MLTQVTSTASIVQTQNITSVTEGKPAADYQ